MSDMLLDILYVLLARIWRVSPRALATQRASRFLPQFFERDHAQSRQLARERIRSDEPAVLLGLTFGQLGTYNHVPPKHGIRVNV